MRNLNEVFELWIEFSTKDGSILTKLKNKERMKVELCFHQEEKMQNEKNRIVE